MNYRYFYSLLCLGLSLILAVPMARALDIKPDAKSLSHCILGAYQEDCGNLDEAVLEYEKALKLDPQSSQLHLNLATVLIKKDDASGAEAELKQAIKLDPQATEPHLILALVYVAQDKINLAQDEYLAALKNAASLEPKNIEIYQGLGALYLEQKKFKEAQEIYKLILALNPKDSQAHFYLGNIYYLLKDFPAVEKELKSAIKLDPESAEALNFLGYFYLEQNKSINQAGALIAQALKLDPENGAYLDSWGWFYFKKGKLQEALVELEKAAHNLTDPVIFEHLGDTYRKLGNLAQAKINWEKSLALDKTQTKIKEKLLQLTNHGK